MVKEGVRLALLAGLSFFITFILDQLKLMDQSETTVAVGIFILRLADKAVYQYQKTKSGDTSGFRGITGV